MTALNDSPCPRQSLNESTAPRAAAGRTGAARVYATAARAESSTSEIATLLLPVVQQVVGRFTAYLPPTFEIADLRGIGLEAMMETLRRYPGKDIDELGRLVRQRARGAILDELRKRDWVSRGVRQKARQYEDVLTKLEQELQRLPTDAEIRKELNLTPAAHNKLLEELRPISLIPLDAQPESEESGPQSWHEKIPDPCVDLASQRIERRERVEQLASAIGQLPETAKKVIALYYFEEMRLAEIAKIFGLTESRICQIHTQAVLALRACLRKAESTS